MKIWKKLTILSKITFIFWTICALYMIISGESGIGIFEGICVWLFGYIFLVGIAQFLSTRKRTYILRENYTVQSNSDNIPTAQENFQNYDSMEGHQFEHFCADVLKRNNFINVEVTQGSGDHGIDILAEKDGISYAIQCKCYSSNIGNAAVQQAHTGKSLYHKDIAAVLTNRYFTAQAKEEAGALGVKLWDRDKLNEMIEKQD